MFARRTAPRTILALLTLSMILAACTAETTGTTATTAAAGPTDAGSTTTSTEADDGTASFEPVELRLAHGVNETHPYHLAALFLQERLPELTDGKLTIAIFPAMQLGDEASTLDLYATGDLEMGVHIAALAGTVVPEVAFLGVPFLWDDLAHWEGVMLSQDTYDYWENIIAAGNASFRLAAIGTAGDRNTMTRDEIGYQSLDDLRGKKLRIPESPLLTDIWRAIGVEPVALPFADVFAALQSGLIDGVGTSPAGAVSISLQEVAKHFYLDRSETSVILFLMRRDFYDSLPQPYQQAVDQALDEMEQVWLEEARGADQEVIDSVFVDAGVTVHEVPDEVRNQMLEIVQPFKEQAAADNEVEDFLQIIEDARG